MLKDDTRHTLTAISFASLVCPSVTCGHSTVRQFWWVDTQRTAEYVPKKRQRTSWRTRKNFTMCDGSWDSLMLIHQVCHVSVAHVDYWSSRRVCTGTRVLVPVRDRSTCTRGVLGCYCHVCIHGYYTRVCVLFFMMVLFSCFHRFGW